MSTTDVQSSLTITKIPNLDTLVIKQRGQHFFISAKDAIIIDTKGLEFLLDFLVSREMIDHTILERILDDHRKSKKG